MEPLEERLQPSVDWTGAAGNGNWDTAANWSGGAVPVATDAVVIDVPGAIVTHSANVADAVFSVTSQDAVVITGGSLSITSTGTFNDALTIFQANLTGAGAVTVNGPFAWWSGVVSSTGGLTVNGTTDISYQGGSLSPVLDGTTLTNHGTITWSTGVPILLRDGAKFANAADGALVVVDGGQLNGVGGPGAWGALDNAGTIETLGNATTDLQIEITAEPGSLIQADGGTLKLGAGGGGFSTFGGTVCQQAGQGAAVVFDGSSRFAATSSIDFDNVTFYDGNPSVVAGSYNAHLSTTISYNAVSFTGSVQSVGALDLEPLQGVADFSPASGGPVNLTLPSLKVYQGTLTGTDGITVNGPFTWWGGVVSNTGGLTVNGATDISYQGGSLNPILDGTTLTNHDTATWTGGVGILLKGGADFVNAADGVFNDVNDGLFGDGFSNAFFDNYGTVNKLGAGTTTFLLSFRNSGTVDVQAGVLNVSDGFTQSDGSTLLDGGSILGGLTIQGGTLAGSGTINGNVQNAGQLIVGQPGTPGTLTINGNFTQTSAGSLTIEIGGANAGTDFDQLVITSQATLGGTLTVNLINGFGPNSGDPGDRFTILTYGSTSGTFTLPLGGDGPLFTPSYNANDLTLVTN